MRISLSMPSPIDTVQLLVGKTPGLARHSLITEDRLGSEEARKIPIAMAFGDQDSF